LKGEEELDNEYIKVTLEEQEIPKYWYNIQADMPNRPKAPINPQTNKPIEANDLAPIFAKELIQQEMTTERWIEIPDEVRKMFRQWRPAPLYRARGLEKFLGTPAKIFYKYEGVNATGSHKLNTSIPQAYYNKNQGVKRLATETGAGQWGSALSLACSQFGLECTVYMVKISFSQKPYRRSFMETFGARVIPSPSNLTESGRSILAQYPDSLGSLGMAISEAVEDAATHDDTNYVLGSVLNHVCLHQTIIGTEAKKQMEKVGEYPDIVIGCCGGGSNFSGIAFPFLEDKFKGKKLRAIAVEPSACPTLTRGKFAYDFADTAKLTPILSMYTLGHDFMPPGIHAGGLRYHGASPLVSQLFEDEIIEASAYGQTEVFEAAVNFARTEGIVPAPESAHAIKQAIVEALKAKESGEEKTILFCLSGHGYFDFTAYDNYFTGKIKDADYSDEQLNQGLINLPEI